MLWIFTCHTYRHRPKIAPQSTFFSNLLFQALKLLVVLFVSCQGSELPCELKRSCQDQDNGICICLKLSTQAQDVSLPYLHSHCLPTPHIPAVCLVRKNMYAQMFALSQQIGTWVVLFTGKMEPGGRTNTPAASWSWSWTDLLWLLLTNAERDWRSSHTSPLSCVGWPGVGWCRG